MVHGRITRTGTIVGLTAAFMALAVFSGCQQMATYPAIEVTGKYQWPSAEPVPTIVAECYRYAQQKYVKGEALPINLPENVPADVYDKVLVHLNKDTAEGESTYRPMIFPDEKAIHFTEVRTRGMHAQVDLIYPTTAGFHQLVTLSLDRSVVERWKVRSERKWLTRNLPTPQPNYVPPPPGMDAKQKMAAAKR